MLHSLGHVTEFTLVNNTLLYTIFDCFKTFAFTVFCMKLVELEENLQFTFRLLVLIYVSLT